MKLSIDFITKMEGTLFNGIMSDFTELTTIMLYSDKCTPKEFQKLEDAMRRGNRKIRIQDCMLK
jgi:hypothetical protein